MSATGAIDSNGEGVVPIAAYRRVRRQYGCDARVDGHAVHPLIPALNLNTVGCEVCVRHPECRPLRVDLIITQAWVVEDATLLNDSCGDVVIAEIGV